MFPPASTPSRERLRPAQNRTRSLNAFRRRHFATVCAALVGFSSVGAAQSRSADSASQPDSRAALEAQLRKAEAEKRMSESFLLKTRLEQGDFLEGDRIVVKVHSAAAMMGQLPGSDTVTLKAGKVIQLWQMADLSLDGVLRSELNSKISGHVARYLRDSSVTTTPLLRIAIWGQVRSPGYFYTTLDILLNDLLMRAGGPSSTANLDKMTIRRGSETIWSGNDVRMAMTEGLSLERLNLRGGDELYVDEVKTSGFSMARVMSVLGPMLGVLYALNRVIR